MDQKKHIHFHSIAIFCCAGVVLPFFLPGTISNLLKPVAMLFCLFIILKKQKGIIKIQFEHICLLVLSAMYFIALIRSLGTDGVTGTISYILYLLFVIFSISCVLDKSEVKSFVWLLYVSTAVFSLCVAISNPMWSSNIYNRTSLNVLWISMNSNQIAYVSLIGFALVPYMLDNQNSGKGRIFHLIVACIFAYIILLTISRSAFLAFLAICFLYLISLLKRYRGVKKIGLFVLLCILSAAAIVAAFKFLPEDQLTRLLSENAYSDSNGRIEMYADAINAVSNPLIGNGPGTYTGSGKIHNTVIKVYFETGIIGAVLIAALLCKLIFSSVQNPSIYLVVVLLFQAMLESGDAYTFWVLIILIYHMSKEANRQKSVNTKT